LAVIFTSPHRVSFFQPFTQFFLQGLKNNPEKFVFIGTYKTDED